MANYNYFEAVKADVKEWIEYNMDLEHDIITGQFEDRDEIEDYLNDTLWTEDSVTGNASGSYTCNTYEAEENLAHNWDLMVEVANEFGEEAIINDGWDHGAEYWDVTIRCYLLNQVISEVLDELEEDIEAAIAEREADDTEEMTA